MSLDICTSTLIDVSVQIGRLEECDLTSNVQSLRFLDQEYSLTSSNADNGIVEPRQRAISQGRNAQESDDVSMG
jgi:hypothetical protein